MTGRQAWRIAFAAVAAMVVKFKVPAQEKTEVLGALTTLKSDIVEKP